ncbi:hypothetical protein AB0K60_23385 [Thermopolyspora sp. NPDC052614]|uniref:hypothetical protein n=1 Tax=Thermopolyspora sp. NPDC052614 TaxID=3155682 RepID=UPI0034321E01
MSRGRAAVNRTGLALTGLLLWTLGGGALLRGMGVFGAGQAARPVVGGDLADFARDRLWFWPAMAAGGFLLVVAGVWWLSWLLRGDRARRVRLRSGPPGLSEVPGAPVGRMIAARVGGHPEVRRVRAVLRGAPGAPWLDLRLTVRGVARIGDLPTFLGRAVPGPRSTPTLGKLPTVVRLRLAGETGLTRNRGGADVAPAPGQRARGADVHGHLRGDIRRGAAGML